MLLLCALIVGSSSAWADITSPWSYTFNKTGSAEFNGYNQTRTLSDVSWKLDATWGDAGSANPSADGTSGLKVGSNSKVPESMTLTTSDIPGTISSIKVTTNCRSKANSILSVTVGGTSFKCDNKNTVNIAYSSSTPPTYEFVGESSGDIIISWQKNTSAEQSGAFYATKIEVTFVANDTRTATTTTIDDSCITNLDIKNGTAAGTLTAIVKAGETRVSGATVSWKSDNEDVAEVASDGSVTLIASGTTKITATYAGDDYYKGSSSEYEITVVNTGQETTINADFNYTFLGTTNGGSISAKTTVTVDNVDFVFDKISGSNWPRGDETYIRIYDGTTMQIKAPSGYAITNITLVSTGGDWKNGMTVDSGTYDDTRDSDNKTYWSGLAESVTFSPKGTHRIASAVVKLVEIKSVAITAAEYATYCNATKALDFSETGIKVFTATDGETSVKLNEITSGKVPANTPVVLYKTAINVPVIASADAVGDNDLNVSDGTAANDNMYVLANKSNGVGFYLWDNSNSNAIPEGKIYLQATSTSRSFLGFEEGNTTSIDVRSKMEDVRGEVYNLNGQRVAQPTKGLYIVNGKKVVVK